MLEHHDRRGDDAQWTKEPRPKRGRHRTRFGASGTLTGALAPLSRPFLPKRAICRSQFAAIYEFMTLSARTCLGSFLGAASAFRDQLE